MRERDGLQRWQGAIFLRTSYLLYAGPVAPTGAHAHHAFQVLVAPSSGVRLRHGTCEIDAEVAVIPPDQAHAFASGAPEVLLLFVDPESAAGRRLTRAGDDPAAWRRAGDALRGLDLALPVSLADADRAVDRILRTLTGGDRPPKALHPAVQRVLRALPSLLEGDVRTPALAALAGLSPGRLSHLFGAEVGIPLRPYVRWLRMLRAAAALAGGATLTAAAHAAGFADAAHLTRTFRATFGIAPSEVTAFATWHAAWPEPARM